MAIPRSAYVLFWSGKKRLVETWALIIGTISKVTHLAHCLGQKISLLIDAFGEDGSRRDPEAIHADPAALLKS